MDPICSVFVKPKAPGDSLPAVSACRRYCQVGLGIIFNGWLFAGRVICKDFMSEVSKKDPKSFIYNETNHCPEEMGYSQGLFKNKRWCFRNNGSHQNWTTMKRANNGGKNKTNKNRNSLSASESFSCRLVMHTKGSTFDQCKVSTN